MAQFFHAVLYQPLYNLLIFFAWLVPGHNMAWAIILITILIRLALLPQSLKAAHLQVKNMALQPKINKIKAEIKDQQEQSKALMELYKKEGISPFSSCLPLLIQLPILWVLFAVFRNGLGALNINDLYSFIPRPDHINTVFLGFDLAKADPWILPIMAAVIQLGLSFMMMPPKQPKTAEAENDPMAMMNKQMLFLPAVITVFFGRTMPAGLVIYWIATTLFSVVQQWYVNKNIKEKAAAGEQQATSNKEQENRIQKSESIIQGEQKQIEKPKKKDFLANMMEKKLDKAEKKADVTVTVRSKKRP
jgi:YidC/Oxa1 family membrane protein insertase